MYDFANCLSININKDRCIRENYLKSRCSDCSDVCLLNAISFTPAVTINKHACINCGLCYAACRFSAVNIKKDNNELLKTTKGVSTIDIGCINADSDIKVACISRITEDLLISWFIEGKLVYVKKGDCKKCKFNKTVDYFMKSLKKAVLLAKSMKIKPKIRIQTVTAQSAYIPKESLSRRDILSSLKLANKDWKTRRQSLIELIQDRVYLDLDYPDSVELSVSDSCTLCGICEHVCPADALLIQEYDDRGVIYFDPSLCVACYECQTACMYGAVSIKQSSLSNMIKKPLKLFEAGKRVCKYCHNEFFSRKETSICSNCRTKQVRKKRLIDFFKDI